MRAGEDLRELGVGADATARILAWRGSAHAHAAATQCKAHSAAEAQWAANVMQAHVRAKDNGSFE